MQQKHTLDNTAITYSIKRYPQSKHIRFSVSHDATIRITAPADINEKKILRYLEQNSQWILEKISAMKRQPQSLLTRFTEEDYKKYRSKSIKVVTQRVDYFAKKYGVDYNKITVRDQKTRWGSCSRKGNLNFSYKLLFLPPEQRDYVVVHEICHLKEFNHSTAFWQLVEQTIPDYKRIRKDLKGRVS